MSKRHPELDSGSIDVVPQGEKSSLIRLCRAKQLSIVLREVDLGGYQSFSDSKVETHPLPLPIHGGENRTAFTLAEVLITLAIIGVVAAMTIPTLITNYNEKVFKERHEIASIKLTEVTRQMNINDDLAPHSSTEAFVNSLSKYFKLGNVCNSDNLTKCFAEEITKSTGEVVEVENLKNSSNLGKNYNIPNYSFTTMDGISYLMTFDPSCEAPDKYNSQLSTTVCLSYIVDVNSSKSPNKIGEDILLVNVSLPSGGCDGIEFEGMCLASADIEFECNDVGSCNTGERCDCYKSVNNACQAIGMRAPNITESADIYTNRKELGNPANVFEGLYAGVVEESQIDQMVAEMKQQVETTPYTEEETALMYYYLYNGLFTGVSYNKIRCVK